MSEYLVTGNEYLSLPTIRQSDGALEGLSFLHMGAKGMIELRGGEGQPLLAPYAEADGLDLIGSGLAWERLHSWVPRFTAGSGGFALEGTLLAPIGERGFGYRLLLRGGDKGAQFKLGLRGCWAGTLHSVNESKPIEAEKHAYASGWNHSFVMDMRPGLSLFAFAPAFTEDGETWTPLPADNLVSMNMWGFTPAIFPVLEARFPQFLAQELPRNPEKAEMYIPMEVGALLRAGRCTVDVLSSPDRWYGVTYREDKPAVAAAMRALTAQGLYPDRPLF